MLLESIDIAVWYYIGTAVGLVFMMWYKFWLKQNKDPNIMFEKRYLVPFLISVIIAVFQLVLEIYNLPVLITFGSPIEAFYTGFLFWAGVQEALKAVLKWDKIDFFNTT